MKKIFIVLMFFLFFQVSGQKNDSLFSSKPKIGLVLSGGGAKGLAHIGVLKTLEKYHIHPDVIGGTSMGAIVGSLYAAGYSARQIDSIFHTMDFDAILYNKYSRKYQHYFIKEHGKKFVFGIPFSFKKMSVQLPSGLSDSQKMFNVLAENLQPVSNIEDFSRLKIPFICISTDIASGEQVLFNQGYLPVAVTASALLPSVYKPLEINNHLLIDGGIVNNYPVNEVRDLGADFIIGSDVQGKILTKKEITDLPAIMDQIVSFGMYKEMPAKRLMLDLNIKPDISGIGLTDFEKIDSLIKRGERAAENKIKSLDLTKIQSDYEVKDLHYKKPDSLLFDEIIIQGQKKFKRDYILGKIDIRPHQKISYHDFMEGINNLIGTENFEKIHYRFLQKNHRNILSINLKEARHKSYVNLGFHYNDLYKINVIGNFENKHIFTNNDLLSIDVIGGNYFRYNIDYIIDNGFSLTWGLHSGLHRFSHRVDAKALFSQENFSINKLDFNYISFANKLYFQGNLSHFFYLRVGVQHQYKRLYTDVFSGSEQSEAFDFANKHYFGNYASVNFDNRDDYDFPTKGWFFQFKWNYYWLTSDKTSFQPFSLYLFDLNKTLRINKLWLIQPGIKAGIHYSKSHSYENMFYLGGLNNYNNFDNLVAFAPVDLLSVNALKFASFSFANYLNIHKNHYFSFSTHLLRYNQCDDLWSTDSKNLFGYNLGYYLKSFLGPLKLNWGYVPKLKKSYFSVGLGYDF